MTRETAGSRRDPERVGATGSICAVVTLRAAGVATGPGSVGVVYNRWACAQFNVPSATSQFAGEKVSKRRTVPSGVSVDTFGSTVFRCARKQICSANAKCRLCKIPS